MAKPAKLVRRFPAKSPGKLYYGPWPNVDMMRTLKAHNVDTVWNLASELKSLVPYQKYFVPNVIQGDITDFDSPSNMGKFATQLNKVVSLLEQGKNVFVHCFGGHGRTGMALAAIDMLLNDDNPTEALKRSYQATGGPEEYGQIEFVEDLYHYLRGEKIPKRKTRKERLEEQYLYGKGRGYFRQDPRSGQWFWVEDSGPSPNDPLWGPMDEWDWEEENRKRMGEPIRLNIPEAEPKEVDPGQSLSFMEWWGKHPEFKQYDAAKAYWASEQRKIRKKLKQKQKGQSEFCPYCDAHLMYPRDDGHIEKHLKSLLSLPPSKRPAEPIRRMWSETEQERKNRDDLMSRIDSAINKSKKSKPPTEETVKKPKSSKPPKK